MSNKWYNSKLSEKIGLAAIILAVGLGSGSLMKGCSDLSRTLQHNRGLYIYELFQDIDGDGKLDMVYSSKKTANDYELYFKRNLGDGKFDEPALLLKSDIHPKGFPILYYDELKK